MLAASAHCAAAHPAPMLRHSGVPGGAVPGRPMPGHLCSLCMVQGWKKGIGNAAGQGWAGGQGASFTAAAGPFAGQFADPGAHSSSNANLMRVGLGSL